MTILEETLYRLACCQAKTGDGWGDDLNLREYLQGPVAKRLDQLRPFVNHIEALPGDNGRHHDESVWRLLQENLHLTQAKNIANKYLRIVEISPKPKETGRLRTCLRKLGILK